MLTENYNQLTELAYLLLKSQLLPKDAWCILETSAHSMLCLEASVTPQDAPYDETQDELARMYQRIRVLEDALTETNEYERDTVQVNQTAAQALFDATQRIDEEWRQKNRDERHDETNWLVMEVNGNAAAV